MKAIAVRRRKPPICPECKHAPHDGQCGTMITTAASTVSMAPCRCSYVTQDSEQALVDKHIAAASNAENDPRAQASIVAELLAFYNNDAVYSLQKGARCYIIAAQWWSEWCEWVDLPSELRNLSPSPGASANAAAGVRHKPGKIANAGIVFDGYEASQLVGGETNAPLESSELVGRRVIVDRFVELRHPLRQNTPDIFKTWNKYFQVVPAKLWEFLKQWFGCDIEIPRTATQVRMELPSKDGTAPSEVRTCIAVNLFPLPFRFEGYEQRDRSNTSSFVPFLVSPLTRVGDLASIVQADPAVTVATASPYCDFVLRGATLPGSQDRGEGRKMTLAAAGLKPFDTITCRPRKGPQEPSTPMGPPPPASKRKRQHDDSPIPTRVAGPPTLASSDEVGVPKDRGCVGLRNVGNTCFMNSSLQVLNQCVGLTSFILNDKFAEATAVFRAKPRPDGAGNVAEQYSELIKKIWSSGHVVLAPVKFKNAISTS